MELGEIRILRKRQSIWDVNKGHKILTEKKTTIKIIEIPEGRKDDLIYVTPIDGKAKWSVYYSKTTPVKTQ